MVIAALPTVHFVIGLREGVEAALIVGIIATFLQQQGRSLQHTGSGLFAVLPGVRGRAGYLGEGLFT